jgi:phospholipase/lecithinase/hemolysin
MKNNSLPRSILSISTLAICCSPLLASPAFATVERLTIFGDSLSDVNNLAAITGGYPPAPFYKQGRFSNGQVWVEHLQGRMNLQSPTLSFYQDIASLQASKSASLASSAPIDFSKIGFNFAIGGAGTDGHISPEIDRPELGLLGQINTYQELMLSTGSSVDANTLFVVSSGPNDYFGLTPADFLEPLPAVQKTVDNLLKSLDSLAAMGATQIAITNMANLGDTPLAYQKSEEFGINLVDGFNQITAAHNSLLAEGIVRFKTKNPDIALIDLDINNFAAKILDNPSKNGLIEDAKTKSCTNLVVPVIPDDFVRCEDPQNYFYYDDQHPVEGIHAKLADYSLREIRKNVDPASVPEPSTVGTLGLLGFGLLWKSRRKNK